VPEAVLRVAARLPILFEKYDRSFIRQSNLHCHSAVRTVILLKAI
jgi:hypothetical protein